MNSEIAVGLLSLLGTVAGSLAGILASSKLTRFRLEQLEHKVDRLGNFGERLPVIEERIKVINHRLCDLEQGKCGEVNK